MDSGQSGTYHGKHFRPRERSAPRPGRGYVTGLVLTQAEIAQFLIRSADEYAHFVCEEHPCEVCDGFCVTWHEIYSELSASYRAGVEDALEALDIRSPRPRTGGF